MAKTSIRTGWCVDGLTIIPEGTWRCSICAEYVTRDDQTTKGGWFDYDDNGKLSFIHVDCYLLEDSLKKKILKQRQNRY